MQTNLSAQEFAGKLLGIYTGGVLTKLIDIGYQTGLFEASVEGAATSDELAARAGLDERYVREWLGAMATSGIFLYDAASGRYRLPQEHAVSLTGAAARNVSPMSGIIDHFGKHLPRLVKCFREGGGIPYSEYRPEFTCHMDATWRRIYDEMLISGFLGRISGLTERLAAGIGVLDVGCGSGHAVNVMAREFPRSRFVGYDLAEDAIADGRAEASRMGLANVRFDVLDVAKLPGARFALITAFDAIHDQLDPATVLARINAALEDDGNLPDDRLQIRQRRRGQHRQSPRAALLRYQPDALHDRVARLRRRRAWRGVGDREGKERPTRESGRHDRDDT
jgi:SAM-dependent methyltransferase